MPRSATPIPPGTSPQRTMLGRFSAYVTWNSERCKGHRGIAGDRGGRRQSALRPRDGGSCLHAVSPQELETLTNEIRDEISKTIILNDETWEGLRCRICPSCATAIPTCFCTCLECEAQLISTGRFCFNISSGDDDDDHEPNVSGDARRAQEEANDNGRTREGWRNGR